MNHGYIALVIPGLFFVALVWYLVSHSLRGKSTIAPVNEHQDVDTEGLTEDQHEKSSLLTWVRRSSRGRFADTNGSHMVRKTNNLAPGRSEAHHRFSLSTLFVRSSLVPHIASVTAKPPPGHQFPPIVSSPLVGPPSGCTAPTKQGLIQIPDAPRVFIPSLRISLRSISGPTLPSMMSTLHPQMTARSVSDSDSTLHPFSTTIKRLPSRPTVPSRALLLAREPRGLNVIMRMPVGQRRTDARLPIGRVLGEGAGEKRRDDVGSRS